MTLESFCAVIIALLFGAAVAFGGYRLFLFILPIWGFFFGFVLGGQTIQALLGTSLFADALALVVAFIVGVVFAILSYLFYLVAVAIIAGSLGYGLAVGLWTLIIPNPRFDFLVWLVGIVVGVALAVAVLRFNIQKYVIIIATALGGAGLIAEVLLLGVKGAQLADALNAPLKTILSGNPLVVILFFVVAVAGIAYQYQANRNYEIKMYNRMSELSPSSGGGM